VPPRLKRLQHLLLVCSAIDIVCIIATAWYGTIELSLSDDAALLLPSVLQPRVALVIAETNITLALVLMTIYHNHSG
jgi:hypothetical protein